MSSAQREEMKQRISTAANALFKEQGFANVSLRKIAKEIGCTPMTLYGYYAGKIDILRSLWGEVFDDLFDELNALSRDLDPVVYLQSLCTAYVNYWIRHSDGYRLVFMAEGVTQPDVSFFVDHPEIVAHYTVFLSAIHHLNTDAPEAIVKSKFDFMLSTLHGITQNKITISGYDWTSPKDQIGFLIKAIL